MGPNYILRFFTAKETTDKREGQHIEENICKWYNW